jgi:glycosyltransferase involved in cell wall biosynthesis
MEPKVSVIMPVYNAEAYLNECMESVLNQSLKEIEVICVDDGSTDRSVAILEEYRKQDSRLIILRQKNLYAGTARNNGMKIARGKYLSFLDADDIFESDMLEESYKQAEKVNADIVVFGGRCFEKDISKAYDYPALLRTDMLPDNEVFEPDENFEYLFNFTTPSPWNKLYRRSFIEDNQLSFQECKRVNDAYFVKVSLAMAKRIGIVNKNFIYYRTNNSLSLQGSLNESPLQFYWVLSDIKDKLLSISKFKANEKSFRRFSLSFCIYNLERLTDEKAFVELYNALREYIFEQLGIKGTSTDDYYNKYAYNQYMKIMSYSPTAYLLDNCLNLRKNGGKEYLFPFGEVRQGSRIILYAAGNVGKKYYRQIQKTKYCNIVAWVDKSIRLAENTDIKSPDEIDLDDCDYLVIAVDKESLAKEIKEKLITDYKVDPAKIIWNRP